MRFSQDIVRPVTLTVTLVAGDELRATLARIEGALQIILKKEAIMAVELDTLTAQVAANTDVVKSALTLIQGFSAKLDAAVAAALAAGATPAVLKSLTDLSAILKGSDDELAGAVAANT